MRHVALVASIASAVIGITSSAVLAQSPPVLFNPTTTPNPGFMSSLLGKPGDWSGNVSDLFQAKFNYPAAADDMSGQPWLQLNPAKPAERADYYEAVKSYALTAFQGDLLNGCPKPANGWYHSPWLTFSFGASVDDLSSGDIGSGREPICGLTQERPAPVKFLHPNQTSRVQSWAVGMFNGPGGYLLGRIWRNRDVVDLSEMTFPNGTFIAKFLFTEADTTMVPYLAGAPTWQANVYKNANSTVRQTKSMRLIQIDFGIRDSRQDKTGWVYGTFLYFNANPAVPQSDWTKNLVAVGSMWGNDPNETNPANYREQALNPVVAALRDQHKLFDTSVRQTFGWFDRVNGPLDNPESSCLSCHATAQVHKTLAIKHFLTPAVTPDNTVNRMMWFGNVKAGKTFIFTPQQLPLVRQGAPTSARANWTVALMNDFVSTDYSLQLRMAIENARSFTVHSAIHTIAMMSPSTARSFKLTGPIKKVLQDFKKESQRIEREGARRR